MESVKDSLHVFIDNTIAALAVGTRVSNTTMTDHQMAVVSEDGVVLSEGTVGTARDRCFIVQRHGTQLVWSPPIRRSGLISYAGQDYTAPVQQVTHIGYDGASTTATITVTSDNLYIARVFTQDELMFQDKLMPKFGIYRADASATGDEILAGLHSNFVANYKKEVDHKLRIEALSSNAGTAFTAATGNWTFTYGSRTVSYTGADAGAGEAVAGNWIRTGTATTSPIYKIASADTAANTVTLEVEYQGATQTFANATATLEYITAANVSAGRIGLQLRSVARTFRVGQLKYYNTRFRVSLQDFGSTAVTYTTGANEGVGYGARIMELEWFALGTEGFIERIGVPAPALPRQIAVETNTYAVLKIVTDNQVGQTAVHNPVAARNEIIVAGYENPLGSPGTFGAAFYQNAGGADTGVLDVLNVYLAGVAGFTAYTPA